MRCAGNGIEIDRFESCCVHDFTIACPFMNMHALRESHLVQNKGKSVFTFEVEITPQDCIACRTGAVAGAINGLARAIVSTSTIALMSDNMPENQRGEFLAGMLGSAFHMINAKAQESIAAVETVNGDNRDKEKTKSRKKKERDVDVA